MINKIRNLFKKIIKDKKDITSESYTEDDITGEIKIDLHEQEKSDDLPTTPSEYYIEEDSSYTSSAIDLENGKIPFKIKVQMAISSLRNSLYSLKLSKPKKMTIKQDKDLSSKINFTQRIKLPQGFQSVETKVKNKFSKINWGNLHNEFFNEKYKQTFHRSFQYVIIVISTFALGKTVGLILTGSKDFKNIPNNTTLNIDKTNELESQKIALIKNAKLFKTQEANDQSTTKKPVIRTNIACTQASRKSRLPIKLVNTIVLQDSVKSIASVQLRSETLLQEFRVGEKINNLAQIDKIERQKLIIKNLEDGSCESIENADKNKDENSPIAVMSPSKSKQFKSLQKKIEGIENEGNTFKIEKSFIKAKMANVSDLLTQARGIQINNPDGSISFKIVDIEPGGIFAYLGIQNSDVITQINGQSINDLNTVMSLFSGLTNIDQLNLTVKRGGTEVPLEYKFK